MIRCIAIDDEPPALELIKSYIENTPFLQLEGVYHNPIEALEQIQKQKIPLVFLDINMPDLNGMQLSRLLPDFCKVIFTTAYEEYAIESYRVAALDYLVKPFSYEEFLPAAEKAVDYFEQQENNKEPVDYLFIKAEYKLHKVYFNNVLFIENIKDYVRFHLDDKTKLMSLISLKSLEEKLPSNFMKVHRSFIVNKDAITIVERSRIVFGKHFIPIADSHKEEFQQYLSGKSEG